MTRLLIILLCLFSLTLIAQETKKVKEKHKNPWYTEEYSVLKSDKNIKQGNYKKLGYEDCLVINGYYKNNEKDSLWTEYFWRTDIIESQGNYENDKKNGLWTNYYLKGKKNILSSKGVYKNGLRIGVWEFYNLDSELIQKYNFDTKELLYFKPDKESENEYEVLFGDDIQKIKLTNPPMYIGGQNAVSESLFTSKLRYPNEAKANGISGTVWISLFVDKNGKAINHKIEEGIGGGCDEEALRVIKEVPNNWLPGSINGELVIAKYLYPVKFILK